MLPCKEFYVLWICIFWARVETAEVPTSDIFESTSQPTKTELPGLSGNPDTLEDSEKKDVADSTVRSFFPLKGKQKWMRRDYPPADEMLFFNVSVIEDNEEVTLAQLYLHRRRLTKMHSPYHKKLLPSPYRVVLYQVQPNYRLKSVLDGRTMKLASLPVSHVTKGGWHVLDVTAVLRELLINAQGPIELLFGVHFEAPKGIGVPLKHFLKSPPNTGSSDAYKSASYMVVFSEVDPYFEDFDEVDNYPSVTISNSIPTSPTIERHSFKERHLKHKIFKDKINENEIPDYNEKSKRKNGKIDKSKLITKRKKLENEVLSNDYNHHRKDDVARHKIKHKVNDVKRSKADELALQRKNKLKSLPFLHTNEVEEIRQTSRRLTRSLPGNLTRISGNEIGDVPSHGKNVTKPKDIRRLLNNLIKEAGAIGNINDAGTRRSCAPRPVVIDLRNADVGTIKIIAPPKLETVICNGYCFPSQVQRSGAKVCRPGSKSPMSLLYFDENGNIVFKEFQNLITVNCVCR